MTDLEKRILALEKQVEANNKTIDGMLKAFRK